MFYEETQINSCLKCKLCNKRLDKPNILPCGGIICTFCVLSINMANNAFECGLCSLSHMYPLNGFPICDPLVEILSAKPIEVQSSASFKSKQNKLNEMLKKFDQFKLKHKCGTSLIRDYCTDLRNKIRFATDQSTQQINTINQELLDQLNQYEMNSIQAFEASRETREAYNSIVLDTEKLLKQFDSTDNEVSDVNEIIDLLEKEKLKLNQLVFNGNILKFESNTNKLDNAVLGFLAFETNF